MGADYTIWIEAEVWVPGSWDPVDTNSSVTVAFADGSRWYALFLAYANVATLREKNRRTGESLHGRYFRADRMILADDVSRDRSEEVVAHLIATGEFGSAFERLASAAEETQ